MSGLDILYELKIKKTFGRNVKSTDFWIVVSVYDPYPHKSLIEKWVSSIPILQLRIQKQEKMSKKHIKTSETTILL